MDKKGHTWTLNRKTVLVAKVLAAVFQITDSQLIQNIIAVKATRTLALYNAFGAGVVALPAAETCVPKSDTMVRKTVALSEETYKRLERIVKITGKRESNVVEDFVYETVNTINEFYPDLIGLIDAALSVKTGEGEGNPGEIVLWEIYHGTMAKSTEAGMVEKLTQAFKKQ